MVVINNNHLLVKTCNAIVFLRLKVLKRKLLSHTLIMDTRPRTVYTLAQTLGVLTEEVHLLCNFCKKKLNGQELLLFDHFYLQLLWKDDCVFGACPSCLRILGREEHSRYCQLELVGHEMLALVKVPLLLLLVRCRGCYKLLTFTEKIDMVTQGTKFCCVRGWWRGLCRYCNRP